MYIATHLGWVVLSCAVLMFFRKRSIQKRKKKKQQKKKQNKWNSSISRSAGPCQGCIKVAEGKGQCSTWGSPLLEDPSVASQALVLGYPDRKFHIVFLWLGTPGQPPAPAVPGFWILRLVLGNGRAHPAQSSSALHP